MKRAFPITRNVFAVIGVIALCWHGYYFVTSRLQFEWFPWVWEEKMRIPSPSGATDLIIHEGNRGAMSSFRYWYFLALKGESVDPNAYAGYDAVFVCSLPAPKPVWIDDRRLEITHDGCHVFYFRPQPEGFHVVADLVAGPKASQ